MFFSQWQLKKHQARRYCCNSDLNLVRTSQRRKQSPPLKFPCVLLIEPLNWRICFCSSGFDSCPGLLPLRYLVTLMFWKNVSVISCFSARAAVEVKQGDWVQVPSLWLRAKMLNAHPNLPITEQSFLIADTVNQRQPDQYRLLSWSLLLNWTAVSVLTRVCCNHSAALQTILNPLKTSTS